MGQKRWLLSQARPVSNPTEAGGWLQAGAAAAGSLSNTAQPGPKVFK